MSLTQSLKFDDDDLSSSSSSSQHVSIGLDCILTLGAQLAWRMTQ